MKENRGRIVKNLSPFFLRNVRPNVRFSKINQAVSKCDVKHFHHHHHLRLKPLTTVIMDTLSEYIKIGGKDGLWSIMTQSDVHRHVSGTPLLD